MKALKTTKLQLGVLKDVTDKRREEKRKSCEKMKLYM
jgi:hypothetical protein